jgi:hypothetical protein
MVVGVYALAEVPAIALQPMPVIWRSNCRVILDQDFFGQGRSLARVVVILSDWASSARIGAITGHDPAFQR